MSAAAAADLRAILAPRHVAVIGASEDRAKFGGRVMHFLTTHGYAGRISPVHPRADTVLGLPAWRDVRDVPDHVDVALLAVPASELLNAVEACGAAGVRGCVILTADFAEIGDEGALRERALVAAARRHGVRLLGPNCLGYINPPQRLALTSSVALAVAPMPVGAIGLVSQSGSLMASLISRAQDTGAGYTVAASIGNQADLDVCDFIDYFIEDAATRAICAYVEGLRDGRRFLALADRCRAAGKPLLIVKAGRSAAGADITRSHTASLAGAYSVWEAACRDHGVLLLDDPEAMIDAAYFLTVFEPPPADAVAAISPSGGTIAVTADRLAAAGLPLAQPSGATRDALAAFIPPSRPLNPLDIGGLARAVGLPAAIEAQRAYAADPSVGVTLIVVATTPQLEDKVEAWGAAAVASRLPTAIVFTPGGLVDGARRRLRELGCPYTDRLDDALRVMRCALDYGRFRRSERASPPPAAPLALDDLPAAGLLTEPEAKALVARCGIATPPSAMSHDAAGAVVAAERLGYPVVLKGVCRELVHKSDIGAVALDLVDATAVRTAWDRIAAAVRTHLPHAHFEGCTVQTMVREAGVELVIGARHDATFGPVVMVGAGGIHVEILNDVSLALAPLDEACAHALIHALRIAPLLLGARGRPPLDLAAAARALVAVGRLAHALGPRLAELDVNPLLVTRHGVIALDARARLH